MSNKTSLQHQHFVREGSAVINKKKRFNDVPKVTQTNHFTLSGNDPAKTVEQVRFATPRETPCSPQRIHVGIDPNRADLMLKRWAWDSASADVAHMLYYIILFYVIYIHRVNERRELTWLPTWFWGCSRKSGKMFWLCNERWLASYIRWICAA